MARGKKLRLLRPPRATSERGRKVIRIDYEPFEHQRQLHLAPHRIRAAICGARGGKTPCGSHDAVDTALDQPGMWQTDISRGAPYSMALGARDFPQIERVVLPAVLRKIPRELILVPYNHTRHVMTVRGRHGPTDIYFISGKDPESWQGQELYYIWLDEAPLMKELMYHEARTRLSSRRGRLLLTGTPRGPNWVKTQIYDVAQTPEGRDEVYFTTWTTADNPHFPLEEFERARRTMPPNYFKRMYLASWDVFEGQVYEEYSAAVHERRSEDYTFVLPDRRRAVGSGPRRVQLDDVFAGKDWGYGHRGAFVVVGVAADGRRFVLHEEVEDHLLVRARLPHQDSWVRRIRQAVARWGVLTVWCGPDRPENIKVLEEEGIPARPAADDVWEGIQSVAQLMHVDRSVRDPERQSRFVVLSACPRLREELVFYHWAEDKMTGQSLERPQKVDDDTVDALRYAIYSHIVRGTFRREPDYQPV